MNPQLQEINQIITLCDELVREVREIGILKTGNKTYEEYKERINRFFFKRDLKKDNYGP